MSEVVRPVSESLHPVATGHYRVATPAIEAMHRLIQRCLRYRIPGALVYGEPRLGKTQAIEYIRLLLGREAPNVTTYHARCEHKPRHSEGPFFTNLLEAMGDPHPDGGTTSAKRLRLTARVREAASRARSGNVILFLDEAQRNNDNEYEWLRDVHDALERVGVRLMSILVGQSQLLTQKTALQLAGRAQIVARLMVQELPFRGLRSADEAGICLLGYDETAYPEGSGWSFTRFFLPQAFDAGFRLAEEAAMLWAEFEAAHRTLRAREALELPMEYFVRAVEIVLKDSATLDTPAYRPDQALWRYAVANSGYVQASVATSRVLLAA